MARLQHPRSSCSGPHIVRQRKLDTHFHSVASAVRDALHEAKLDPKEMAEERPNKADINQVLDALAEVKPGDGENHT